MDAPSGRGSAGLELIVDGALGGRVEEEWES